MLFQGPSFCSAQTLTPKETAERIHRFEHELGPPVDVVGRPAVHKELSAEMQRLHVPAISIAVVHKGKIEWVKGYGATRKGGSPVTPDTLFQAASISKSVTASAALRLCELGKLSLDAPIQTELKDWSIPPNAFTGEYPVTLRELLSHTAGSQYMGFAGYAAGEAVPTLNEVLDGKKPANSAPIVVEAQPGSDFRYSGGGYTIVQRAMMDVTGEDFSAIMQSSVLSPVGMHESTYQPELSPTNLPMVALPVDQQGKPIPGGPHVYPEMGAASLWTKPRDLAHWILAIQNSLAGRPESLLRATDARAMVTPVKQGYGLGVTVQTVNGVLAFSHTGSNEGYKAMFLGYGDQDGAVVMTNSENGFALIGEVIPTLAKIYGWDASKAGIADLCGRASESTNAFSRLIRCERRLRFSRSLLKEIT